jgi:hypothetical protein
VQFGSHPASYLREKVFVVPFNFQRELVLPEVLNVIHFVRNRLALDSVDDSLYLESKLVLSNIIEGTAHPLRSFGLAAA